MMWNIQITAIAVCLSTLSISLGTSSNVFSTANNSSTNKIINSNSNNNQSPLPVRLQQNNSTFPPTPSSSSDSNRTFCSTFNTIELPLLTINYRSTNTTLTVRLTTTFRGYIGFGLSADGLMEGTEAVIGTPDDVSKYTLGSWFALLQMDEQRQATLTNTSFTQDESGSVLEFTKLLRDGDENLADKRVINGFGTNKFIWALGNDGNQLQFHRAFGSLQIPLSPYCTEDVDAIVDRIDTYEVFFAVHGILAILAFGVIMPIAITASRARSLLNFEFQKKKAWYVIHTKMNSLSYTLTIVLVGLVVVAHGKKGKAHFKGTHEVVGLVTLLLMTVQVVAGVLRPNPYPPTKEVETEVDTAGNLTDEGTQVQTEPKVRLVRTVWQKSHIVMGISTLGCGIYQMHSGVKLYSTLFRTKSYVGALWGVLGSVFFLLAVTIVYSKRRKRS